MVITTSGTIASFKAIEKKPIESLKIYFLPNQSGSGDPSPINPRNISGRTRLVITHSGKNMLDMKSYYNDNYERIQTASGITYTVESDGSITANGTATSRADRYLSTFLTEIPPGKYYADFGEWSSPDGKYLTYLWDDRTKAAPKQWDGITAALTSSNNIGYRNIPLIYPEETLNRQMLLGIRYQEGATADNQRWYLSLLNSNENPNNTVWEPYNGQTYTVDWAQQAGEAYAGYIDIISGDLVITHKKHKPTGHIWLPNGQEHAVVTFWVPEDGAYVYGSSIDPKFRISNLIKYGSFTAVSDGNPTWLYYHDDNVSTTRAYILVYGTRNDYPTDQDFENYLLNNNFEFIYPLATPIHYQLEPLQINTLVGRNNIWCVNGYSTEVSYNFSESLAMAQNRQKIIKFNSLTKEVFPSEYEPVDFLQGIGNQTSIDTGVAGNDNTIQIDFTVEVLVRGNYMGAMLGNHNGEDKKCWRFIQGATGTNNRFNFTLNNRKAGASPSATITELDTIINKKIKVHMEYAKGWVMYNSKYYTATTTTTQEETSTLNIIIGKNGPNIANGSSTVSYVRFHDSIRIRKQGKLIRDYRPCKRRSDGKPGFYDMINKTFNPSTGSKDFIAGTLIGGLYVYADNSRYYEYVNDTVDENIITDSDYFLTGFYDTESEEPKSYTIPVLVHDAHVCVRLFNNKTAASIDFFNISTAYDTRTYTGSGRYIMATVYKPYAANFYIYDNTNQRYIVKGSNVT